MKITFHGGAQEVTGACHLLETKNAKILVDCGLVQEGEQCADYNFEKFKFNSAEIDALVVTHAHIDHIGRIPKLVREGFRGKIYSTSPTKDLAGLLLEDAMGLEARRSHKDQDEFLYTKKDIDQAFSLWQGIDYLEDVEVKGAKIRLNNAGHILGSSLVEMWAEGQHLLFSGDLGNIPSVLLPPPTIFSDIDIMVIESAYGERTHDTMEPKEIKLERAVEDASARGGTLLIPAFATERTQDILHLLNEMVLYKRTPEIPVFVDSPLAIKVTEVFENYPQYYKDEIKSLFLKHPNLFKFKKLRMTPSVEESKSINDIPPPKAIIAGSGMMMGGRILHHASRYLVDPKSILLIVGYQPPNSLGRKLLNGDQRVNIFGEAIEVRAEIRQAEGFSAHADSGQLFSFVEPSRDTLKKVFVVQGESEEALYFTQQVKDRLGVEAYAPTLHQSFELN